MENWKLLSTRLRWAIERKLERDTSIKKITNAEIAKLAGLSPPAVGYWLKDVNGMQAEAARRLAAYFDVDAVWLEKGEDAPTSVKSASMLGESTVEDAPPITGSLKRLPVVGRAQAGPDGTLSIDDFNQVDGFMLWWSTCPQSYALRIRGESMSPRYLPGEFVGVDPCAEVFPSDEVIAQLKDGRKMIKRLLWMREDQACFESVNKNFQNIILDLEEIECMHLVLGNIPKAAFRSD